jgi:hypothetical protein
VGYDRPADAVRREHVCEHVHVRSLPAVSPDVYETKT